jgi:archaellum component FlaC
MSMKILTGLALGLSLTSAEAQQLSAADRIAMQIGQMTIQIHQQQDQILDLQKKLEEERKRVKELEAKIK